MYIDTHTHTHTHTHIYIYIYIYTYTYICMCVLYIVHIYLLPRGDTCEGGPGAGDERQSATLRDEGGEQGRHLPRGARNEHLYEHWPSQDIVLLRYCCARIKHPYLPLLCV